MIYVRVVLIMYVTNWVNVISLKMHLQYDYDEEMGKRGKVGCCNLWNRDGQVE